MKAKKMGWVMLLLAFAGTGSALAHGARVGVYFGPVWGPWGYPPPFYYQSQVVVVPQSPPPVYIEQSAPAAIAEPVVTTQQYWYYCAAAKAYYPYVKECPTGWQKVLPQPAR